ncbi:MFS transporter [Asanoa sp. WMMD1127]|uniref:MFS transporter n=1 Tax=Asanoa sp. WMMD1127 TaxID=3016107 RepID=UPI0024167961|nr:MFS transporter [Asanoa sp. WMMD1127]MDG4821064.1 MFS transporter [Asanoa sp. WMMD1127]
MLLPPSGAPRVLMFATFVNTFGNGAYLATAALFLTRSVGLTAGQVAAGLSAGALAGIALATPMGALADRWGPRRVAVAALVTLACCFAGLTLVHHLWSYVVVACVVAVGDATVRAATGALIAGAVPPAQRVRTRAFVRSTNNAGIALGTAVAAGPLLLDSRAGYLAVLWGNAVTYLLAAAVFTRVGVVARVARPAAGPRLVALRDRPFVAFALVDGLVAALYNGLLALALPLWLVSRTHAPAALVSAALLVNTIGCVTLQVWASRGTDTAVAAVPVSRRGALVVAASCVLFGLTAGRGARVAGVLVLGAAAVHVLGELWLSSATFAVAFDLAPDWAQGQYQGALQTGRQIGNMLAPPLLTALVIGWGGPGWLGLSAVFAGAAVAYPPIVRWALRRRVPSWGLQS